MNTTPDRGAHWHPPGGITMTITPLRAAIAVPLAEPAAIRHLPPNLVGVPARSAGRPPNPESRPSVAGSGTARGLVGARALRTNTARGGSALRIVEKGERHSVTAYADKRDHSGGGEVVVQPVAPAVPHRHIKTYAPNVIPFPEHKKHRSEATPNGAA